MIKKLVIKNYAIIENLEIDFSDKLTIITGETGAGKSILLGALGLIMGNRAETRTLHDETKKCIVEAHFEIQRYRLKNFFKENDIDYFDDLIIRRELTPSGKSRAFINDTPTNLSTLKRLANSLIDLHQQFDTLDIHNVSFQLRMLDALANNRGLLKSYNEKYSVYRKNKRKYKDLVERDQNATNELDFVQFQLNELLDAELVSNEQGSMEDELNTLSNAESIKSTLSAAFNLLSESEQSSIGQLREVLQALSQIKDFNQAIGDTHKRLEGLVYELEDLSNEFEQIAGDTEFDQARIVEIQDRLDQVYRLQNKHKVQDIQSLIDIQTSLQEKIDACSDLTEEIEQLEALIHEQQNELMEIAKELSSRRKAIIPGFEQKVHQLLAQLSMQHARLKIDVQETEELGPSGFDQVSFLFAANLGSRFDLLKNVASGGELSRLTLCTKSLVASAIPLPTLIFDEIDTGISGDVALKMGKILGKLANNHQVISITHTPQIAAKADRHYYVYKQIVSDRTKTQVKELNHQDRIVEIATMLSGNPPSPAAISNAEELLINQ